MDQEDILREVQIGPLGSQMLTDGTYVIENDKWFQVVSPNRPLAARNEVIVSRLRESEVEEKVDEIIDFYKKLGTSFKWVVDPRTEPGGLADVLDEKGFRSWFGRGMYAFVDELNIEAPVDVTVHTVTEENLETYVDLVVEGWELEGTEKAQIVEDYLWAIKRPIRSFHFYYAEVDGQPAGTAGLLKKARSAYLMGGNVLEKFRGRGVYRALIKKRLEDIEAMEVRLVTTGTREETSAPILEKLGFKTAYRDEIFQYDFK